MAALLQLQRTAGNQAVTRLLAGLSVQACGPRSCACSGQEAELPPSGPAAVQRMAADFQVRGKFGKSASEPHSVFFDFNSSAIDAAEDAKLTALAGTPLSTIELRGFVSEEGGTGQTGLVNSRISAVQDRLLALSPGTGVPTRTPDLTSSSGSLDYRSMRKVEILIAGAHTTTPDCSLGADVDCGPVPNPFTKGHDQAKTLLSDALTALGDPANPPAAGPLTELFGGPANAPAVKDGLTKIRDHLPNMVPAIPLNDQTAAGHRCINTCEGDVFAYNQHVGAAARMTLGPRYRSSTDTVEQGLVLIHEGSHGAAGLTTGDHAYRWQRLLAFLSFSEAIDNADSYTQLAALIHDPSASALTHPADTMEPSMPPDHQDKAARALAWLEQYLVQGRLEVRSLYAAANRARHAGAWQADDTFYRDNTMADAAPLFGLTNPPAVPTAHSQWRIAAIFDRLAQLRFAITGQGIHFAQGPATAWDTGPGGHVTLSSAFFGLTAAQQVDRLLVRAVKAAPFIEAGRRSDYIVLVRRMSARRGGP